MSGGGSSGGASGSASGGAAGGGQPVSPGAAADPSMEDILASIRRILTEDDPAPPPLHVERSTAPKPESDVLMLDASMLVPEPVPAPQTPHAVPAQATAPLVAAPQAAAPQAETVQPLPVHVPVVIVTPTTMAASQPGHGDGALLAPDTAAAASASMGMLLKSVATSVDRQTLLHRGGPTLEEMVRDEMRPLLKSWLDENLSTLVERLVRAEIERLVTRATS